MYNKEYCFINSEDLRNRVSGHRIFFGNCSQNSVKVCFESASDCDIEVEGLCDDYRCDSEYDYGYVVKNNIRLYYVGDLLYGAIFSSPEIYECNVKRLMKRLIQQALIYKDEIFLISSEL